MKFSRLIDSDSLLVLVLVVGAILVAIWMVTTWIFMIYVGMMHADILPSMVPAGFKTCLPFGALGAIGVGLGSLD